MTSSIKTEDTLMSSKQLADLMGVSLITLSRWRSGGKGPPFVRLGATRVAYPVRAYREWVESHTIH